MGKILFGEAKVFLNEVQIGKTTDHSLIGTEQMPEMKYSPSKTYDLTFKIFGYSGLDIRIIDDAVNRFKNIAKGQKKQRKKTNFTPQKRRKK